MSEDILNDGHFFSPSKGNLSFDQTINEILGYMDQMPGNNYEVVVGCDSPSSDKPFFPIAVVILRTGFGGRFFLKKMQYADGYLKRFSNMNWKARILQEVYLSCELALSLKEVLAKKAQEINPNLKYEFAYIHADIGERGKTKEMVKEVTGLIRSTGFEPCIKPRSFAASVVADRYT